MSCYEWERGDIVIPASEWSAFRKALIKAWNDDKEKDLADALAVLPKIKEAAKGKRSEEKYKAEKNTLGTFCWVQVKNGWVDGKEKDTYRYHRLHGLLFSRKEGDPHGARTELVTPKKKDMGLLPLTGDAVLQLHGASISLSNASRTVTWEVGENNHACEYARSQPLAKLLFEMLHDITWTRGSGGKIVGNDEYNRDSSYEGGGANFVKDDFSVQTQKASRLARRSSHGRSWA